VPAALLRERGYSVTAYDPYFAPGELWRSRSWDAILVHEVAEHLAEPGETLAELAALLRPGGAWCIRTRFPPKDRESFARWRYRMDSTHVGFFGPGSFTWLSARLGLEIALVEPPDRAVLVRPA
ncbi:MAG TPA: methyltransferase domain-containing protein, partial [Spirochaetales bacterium]|nr:methyltransferase domain-containing protein [Spirochaetales bacterium]